MNFTESFQEFSSRLGPTDLALYAGAGIVLWILFRERLSPIQQLLMGLINKAKSLLGGLNKTPVVPAPVVLPKSVGDGQPDDTFFRLVVSWKQTRDLAQQSGCAEAVKVADQMFPFLSPTVCKDKKTNE